MLSVVDKSRLVPRMHGVDAKLRVEAEKVVRAPMDGEESTAR